MTNHYKSHVKTYTHTSRHTVTPLAILLKKHYCWDVNVWPWALTICSHQETKHTFLYLWLLKGVVCLRKSKAYLTDSKSKEADLGNKTLISVMYMETAFTKTMFRGAERNCCPILVEMVQHFRCRDITIPLSTSSKPPGCSQCWASQLASVLCLL